MARPTKQGVDYFPLDVHLDDKFKFIEIKYGLEGFALLIKLFQKIYSYGYWYKWTEDEALLFADENRVDLSKVDGVVNEAVERYIFDKDLYEKYSILTSRGIQKRYKEAVRRRKDVELIEDYLLIDDIIKVNDDKNPINDDTSKSGGSQNDGKSTQSKVNKTKEDNNKQNKQGRKQVYDESSLYFKMANYFYDLILKNKPDFKKPNLQTWADDCRKIVELDKKDKDRVRKVMEFVQNDDFEMINVLSPSKLRKRFDQLEMKSQKSNNVVQLKQGGAKNADYSEPVRDGTGERRNFSIYE